MTSQVAIERIQRLAKVQSDNAGSIAQVYAQALLEIAEAEKVLDETRLELEQLGKVLESQDGLLRLFSTTMLSIQERGQSLKTIFKDRVSDLLFRFLEVLNQKDRMNVLPAIIRAFDQLVDERNGIVDADLLVAGELSQAQVKKIGDRVSQAIGRKVVLQQHVNPQLIGGLILRVGDRVMDGTVAAQLRLIRHKLIDTGQQKVRTDTDKLIQA